MLFTTAILMALFAAVSASNSRTFAVNHFYGNGPLTSGRADPIVSPGAASSHSHTIQGGSNFALTLSDTALLDSSCTSSVVTADKSAYWTPSLYFQHSNGSFETVPMFYMNVYYFFEATDDTIKAFQPGHRMFVGNVTARSPPYTASSVLDSNQGAIQPVQWTCPRNDYSIPAYPVNSDGLHGAGIQDPGNAGAGVGFPHINCDAFASPLRADIHFPSCYNPAAGLDNYKENMQFPSSKGTTGGKSNCPAGWVHVPHLFYEVYWNTLMFKDEWTPGQGKQPFVLSNGDPTGYSLHADFIAGWDVNTLQQVIDNCNTGSSGIEKCPGLLSPVNDGSKSCNIPIPKPAGAADEVVTGMMDKLPGNNPVSGWGATVAGPAAAAAPAVVSSAAASGAASSSAAASKSISKATSTTSSATTKGAAFVQAAEGQGSAVTPVVAADPAISTDRTVTVHRGDSTTTITRTVTRSRGSTATNAAATTTGASIGGFNSMGCFSDSRERVLSDIVLTDIANGQDTTSKCIAYCDKEGFSMAGTEFHGECYCGNALVGSSRIADASCHMPCRGNSTEICGGDWALSVYQKPNAADAAAATAPADAPTAASAYGAKRSIRVRHVDTHAHNHAHAHAHAKLHKS